MKVKIYNSYDKVIDILHSDDVSFIDTTNDEDAINTVEDAIEFCNKDVIVVVRYKKPIEQHHHEEAK